MTVVEEQIVYPFTELIADIGGVLGENSLFKKFSNFDDLHNVKSLRSDTREVF